MTQQELAIGERPSSEETLELHLAYRRYQESQPWRFLPDNQPLVIHQPENRRSGYLVTGAPIQRHDALAYYHGRNGLYSYLTAQPPPGRDTTCMSIVGLPPNQLNNWDLQNIKSIRAGYRGNQPRPVFRSHIPHHPPWAPNLKETLILTEVLDRATEFARYCETQDNRPEQPARDLETPAQALVWSGPEQPISWTVLPNADQLERELPVYDVDGFNQATEQAQPSTQHWNIAFLHPSGLIYDEAGQNWRPYYKTGTFVIERETQQHHVTYLQIGRFDNSKHQRSVANAIRYTGIVPAEITVENHVAMIALKPVAKRLGIRLHLDIDMTIHAKILTDFLQSLPDSDQSEDSWT